MNLDLNIWSLFSGIGGLDKGLEDAGLGYTSVQAEQDDFCLKVLSKRFPLAKKVRDVKFVSNKNQIFLLPEWEVGKPNVICGGFPCQPVSVVGKGLAQDDERWLWDEFERVIGEFTPEWVVIENVPGLRKRGFGLVLDGLANLGYDAEWVRLSAAAVGAPHLRERLFIVSYPGSARRSKVGGRTSSDEGEHAGRRTKKDHVTDSVPESNSSGSNRSADVPRVFTEAAYSRLPLDWKATQWATEPKVDRVAYGVPGGVDRLRALGNAVVPQCAQFVGECIVEAIKNG